jgi:hypothetical protein
LALLWLYRLNQQVPQGLQVFAHGVTQVCVAQVFAQGVQVSTQGVTQPVLQPVLQLVLQLDVLQPVLQPEIRLANVAMIKYSFIFFLRLRFS